MEVGIVKARPKPRTNKVRGGDLRKFARAVAKCEVGQFVTYGRAASGNSSLVIMGVEEATGRVFHGFTAESGYYYYERVK